MGLASHNIFTDQWLLLIVTIPDNAPSQSNREFMIKALVILGADLNQRNESGMTVYDVAKKESCRSTMTLLAAVGADDRKYLDCKQYPPISQEC